MSVSDYSFYGFEFSATDTLEIIDRRNNTLSWVFTNIIPIYSTSS